MSHHRLALLLLLPGCCGRAAPTWVELEPLVMEPDERVTVDLAEYASDDGELRFTAEPGPGVLADLDGTLLTVIAETGFEGEARVDLVATDACDQSAAATLPVVVGDEPVDVGDACLPHLEYTARGTPDAVFVAGTFNDWNPAATPLVDEGGGRWALDLELPAGSYPYKLVEVDYDDGGVQRWACDPEADFVQCDEGYTWDPSCPLDGASCNSLLVVPDCGPPILEVTHLAIDREARTLRVQVSVSGGEVATAWATLDGKPVEAWTGEGFTFATGALSEGRHTLRFGAATEEGKEGEEAYVPVWLDDRRWEQGLLYYVFVDRFANGDSGLDQSEGTSTGATDYLGGDWQGVIDRLDYLDELGVTVLWLTAPQDNAEGPWEGSCNSTYSGYHGYWPSEAITPEEHFGDEATLHDLVDEAHARGMRVLTDWVANHVHVDHPYYREHPEWFNPLAVCGDANNWNDIPETCWFDDYLPDVRYYDVEPLERMVDDAMWWVKAYELDGFRVDAVKHMPHSVYWNFQSRVRAEVEHGDAGGDEEFYTVGETYSGDRGLIASYVNPDELDGQFDFPTYWSIVSAFAREESGLSNGAGSLQATFADSEAAFAGSLMSTFLGNHDVARFLPQATGEIASLYGDSACGSDGNLRPIDYGTDDPTPYRKLMLAWSFLLTTPGLPLVYYGDELGLPGYNDPDNRQMMRFDGDLSGNEAMVLAHVRRLGQARLEHPALSTGATTTWWAGEAGFYAYARVSGGDEALVLLNRDPADRTVSNGLAFAGLTADTWEDVLTGETFTATGDSLTLTIPARGSRVLVAR